MQTFALVITYNNNKVYIIFINFFVPLQMKTKNGWRRMYH